MGTKPFSELRRQAGLFETRAGGVYSEPDAKAFLNALDGCRKSSVSLGDRKRFLDIVNGNPEFPPLLEQHSAFREAYDWLQGLPAVTISTPGAESKSNDRFSLDALKERAIDAQKRLMIMTEFLEAPTTSAADLPEGFADQFAEALVARKSHSSIEESPERFAGLFVKFPVLRLATEKRHPSFVGEVMGMAAALRIGRGLRVIADTSSRIRRVGFDGNSQALNEAYTSLEQALEDGVVLSTLKRTAAKNPADARLLAAIFEAAAPTNPPQVGLSRLASNWKLSVAVNQQNSLDSRFNAETHHLIALCRNETARDRDAMAFMQELVAKRWANAKPQLTVDDTLRVQQIVTTVVNRSNSETPALPLDIARSALMDARSKSMDRFSRSLHMDPANQTPARDAELAMASLDSMTQFLKQLDLTDSSVLERSVAGLRQSFSGLAE